MFSTPTVVGDLLFIGSCAGKFYAINKATGQLKWHYDIRLDGKQISFHGDPLVTGDLILIGTDHNCVTDGIGHVYAFERETGKVRWKYPAVSVPTDILRLGSNIYFGSFQDTWSSVDLRTGTLKWNFSTGASNENCDLPRSAMNKDHLLITGRDGVIYALNAFSGKVSWKRKLPAIPSTGVAVRDNTVYVGTDNQRIYRLNAETGAVISELALEAKPVRRLAFHNDSLIMFLENRSERVGYIVSVDSKLTRVAWTQRSSPDWASQRPHLWKGYVVAGNCRGEAAAFRATNGEPDWKLNVKGCISSIGSAGDMLFLGVQEGSIYAFDLL